MYLAFGIHVFSFGGRSLFAFYNDAIGKVLGLMENPANLVTRVEWPEIWSYCPLIIQVVIRLHCFSNSDTGAFWTAEWRHLLDILLGAYDEMNVMVYLVTCNRLGTVLQKEQERNEGFGQYCPMPFTSYFSGRVVYENGIHWNLDMWGKRRRVWNPFWMQWPWHNHKG